MSLPAVPDYIELVECYADTGVSRDAPSNANLPPLTLDAIAACIGRFGDDALNRLTVGSIAQLIMLTKGQGKPAVAEAIGYLILQAIENECLPLMSRDVREAMAQMRAERHLAEIAGFTGGWRFPANWM